VDLIMEIEKKSNRLLHYWVLEYFSLSATFYFQSCVSY